MIEATHAVWRRGFVGGGVAEDARRAPQGLVLVPDGTADLVTTGSRRGVGGAIRVTTPLQRHGQAHIGGLVGVSVAERKGPSVPRIARRNPGVLVGEAPRDEGGTGGVGHARCPRRRCPA